MPDHIKLILRHAAYGGAISVAFVAAILWMNVGNLRHLVTHTEDGPLAVIVLTVLCWITFGSVQIGIRIMTMAADDDQGRGTGGPEVSKDPVPVRARASHGQ